MGHSSSKNSTLNESVIPSFLYNLKGHIIPMVDEGYYNLGTNRKNKDKRSDLIVDDHFKVQGTEEELRAFYEINHITEHTACSLKGENTIVYAPDTDDIEKLDVSLIQNLCPFNLFGLQTKGRVVNVHDGDTIDLAIYIPLKFLYSPRYYQKERMDSKEDSSNIKQVSLLKSAKPTSKKIAEGGLFAVFNCRLLNVDAAESNTRAGQIATEKTIELYQSLKNILYVRCNYFDKYGRLLVDLYSDPKYRHYLNFYLVEHPDPKIGILATRYDGGTKEDVMKNMQKISRSKQ